MSRQQPEFQLQKQVCAYLDLQYKEVLYMSNGTSLKLTKQQAQRNKAIQKDGFSVPDMFIAEPINGCGGLYIELKVVTPFKKDGTLKKSKHLEKQYEAIRTLRNRGYIAEFSWGFYMTKQLIDCYLAGEIL